MHAEFSWPGKWLAQHAQYFEPSANTKLPSPSSGGAGSSSSGSGSGGAFGAMYCPVVAAVVVVGGKEKQLLDTL